MRKSSNWSTLRERNPPPTVPPPLSAARLAVRQGHFMPSALLQSQFDSLEEPTADEPAIRVDIGPAPEEIVQRVVDALGLQPSQDGAQS